MYIFHSSTQTPVKSFESYKANITTKVIAVVFDSAGKLEYRDPYVLDHNIVAILGHSVSQEYLDFLKSKNISYLFAGPDGKDLHLAMEKLYSEFGIKRLAREGGGTINGSMLKVKLIDEISIVLSPSIDGLSGVPSIFDYHGKEGELPAEGQSLELIKCTPMKYGSLHLLYKVYK